jgi:hypothetical protein
MAIVVELFYSGAWQDISQYVDDRAPISITRGLQNEGTAADPSSCTLTLNNRDGRFSPRNPSSPLYGLIGRNTPLRVTKDSSVRFVGEVSAWPQRWEVAGKDVWVELQAAGILRRLGQGQPSKDATYRQWLLANTTPARYWPLTGATALIAETSTSGGKFLTPNVAAAQIGWGKGALGDYLESGTEITTTAAGGNLSCLNVGVATLSAKISLDFVFQCDTLSGSTFAVSIADFASYPADVKEWTLNFRPDGVNNDIQVKLTVTDYSVPSSSTSAIGDSGPLTALTDGGLHHVRLQLDSTFSTDTTWTVFVDGVSVATDIQAGENVGGGIEHVSLAYIPGTDSTALSFGHLAVYTDTPPTLATQVLAAHAFAGETAADRISRICADNGITYTLVGTAADTAPMGPQGASTSLVALLQEAASTDLGILYEPRSQLGLAYRTRTSLYNQVAAVALDYSAKMIASPPDVTDDDQGIHNDVTVSNAAGGTAEAILQTGPLSIQAPPNGINTYATSASVNTQTDGPLPDIAAWLLHLSTIDAARCPQLTVDMLNPAVAGVLTGLKTADVSSKLIVQHLPSWMPPDDFDVLVVGYTETITQFTWDIVDNCVPADPYQVAVYGSASLRDGARFDAENSTLASPGATTTATSLNVASAAGTVLWTTAAGEFPFDIIIAGERITVTNITGSSSPQVFTVTRSVNGVVKTHTAGEKIRLYFTPLFGL